MGTIDQGFVPAAPDAVYARIADVAAYPTWWPRTQASDDGSVLSFGGMRGVAVTMENARPGQGVVLRLAGGAGGSLEWYLERFDEGTVVNAILDLDGPRPRAVLRVRASLREAMVALRRWGEVL